MVWREYFSFHCTATKNKEGKVKHKYLSTQLIISNYVNVTSYLNVRIRNRSRHFMPINKVKKKQEITTFVPAEV